MSTQSLLSEKSDRVLALAKDVFGNHEKALLRLHSPHCGLADQVPLAVLQTEEGILLVESLLWQLDEGVYQ